jgi:hypothetical protein
LLLGFSLQSNGPNQSQNQLLESDLLDSHLETEDHFVFSHVPVVSYLKLIEAIRGFRKLRSVEICNLYIPKISLGWLEILADSVRRRTHNTHEGGLQNSYRSLVLEPEQKIPVQRRSRGK